MTGLITNIDEIAGARSLGDLGLTGTFSGQTWTAEVTSTINPVGAQALSAATDLNFNSTASGAFYGPNGTQTAGTFRINDNGTRFVTGALLADRPL